METICRHCLFSPMCLGLCREKQLITREMALKLIEDAQKNATENPGNIDIALLKYGVLNITKDGIHTSHIQPYNFKQ